MTTQLRPGTIAALTAGTAAAGLLAYAMYFDHRRRSDPEFRKALKRESKRTARAAKQEAEADRTAKLREVRQVVDEMTDLPTSQEEVEAYFMEQVAQGERISQDGRSFHFWQENGREALKDHIRLLSREW